MMTPMDKALHDAEQHVRQVIERNARAVKAGDKLAGAVVGFVVGILGALALVHFLTPCDTGAMCMAAAITRTRTGPLAWLQRQMFRLHAAGRAWYWRRRVFAAERDIDTMTEELEWLPHQISHHQMALDAMQLRLVSAEIDARGY